MTPPIHCRSAPGDRGSVTVWILGFCIGILFMGGLSVDLWNAFTERREMAGMADGAVVAGATAVDTDEWRATGLVVLDPGAAFDRAGAYLGAHPEWDGATTPAINAAPNLITVALERQVNLTLMRVLLPGEEPLTVRVTASATPALQNP